MKIIDNKKDYYDYLQGIIGMDEKVVYDRRGSTVIEPSEYYNFDYPIDYDLFFSKKPFKCDKPKQKKEKWTSRRKNLSCDRVSPAWQRTKNIYVEEGDFYYLLLEVGYHEFIFEVERYLDEDGKVKLDTSIVKTKTLTKKDKRSEAPLFIGIMYYGYSYLPYLSKKHDNPILAKTWIPKFIPAEDMWNMLYEYISSLNDKDFVDTRTNDQHIESHGFDKKISFRHRNRD